MPQETTSLTPQQEQAFQAWAKVQNIKNFDHPDAKYDMRGYWLDIASKGGDQTKEYGDGPHFPDTYKQHGHPTFSVESKYSTNPEDGGSWDGETYVPQSATVPMATSRKSVDPAILETALLRMMKRK